MSGGMSSGNMNANKKELRRASSGAVSEYVVMINRSHSIDSPSTQEDHETQITDNDASIFHCISLFTFTEVCAGSLVGQTGSTLHV